MPQHAQALFRPLNGRLDRAASQPVSKVAADAEWGFRQSRGWPVGRRSSRFGEPVP
jgi:hypothetical protein